MTHGTRGAYQQGCKCLPCRAANADYEAAYRDRKRRGLPMLGSVVSAVETWRQLRLLTTEYDTRPRKTKGGDEFIDGGRTALARRLGLKDRHLQFGKRVTLRTALRVNRQYQMDILAGLPVQPEAMV